MKTIELSTITPEVMADAQIVADCLAARRPVPQEVARRVHKRAECARQDILDRNGVLDIGVPIIRELRGELPEP